MILKFEQIQNIVLKNPSKTIIDKGKEISTKLMRHVYGRDKDSGIQHMDFFASKDLFEQQKKCLISNRDVISRLLQQEDMIYSAQGGSSYFNLPDADEQLMNETLSNVKYGQSLRSWVKHFAREAYRCDPMGIIFIEIESSSVNSDGELNEPKVYPTYKSVFSIYDYHTEGRNLEYVCFRIKAKDAISFGIQDAELEKMPADQETDYYRIIDDAKDLIVKRADQTVSLVTNITQANPLPNPWARTPAFMVSDIMVFDEPKLFVSPLNNVVELADTYLYDRSVRELQKKYHGFAKAIEPLLKCGTCSGLGVVDGGACKDCTPPGAVKGSGYKIKTKPSDVARFPIENLEKGFDWQKIFGYATPDIESWNKQDASLEDLEELMEMTYWGTVRMRRTKPGNQQGDQPVTAREVDSNEAPKIARLNQIADWQENTENLIAWYIGKYLFPDSFKKPSITLGREYVLKSADELMDFYLTLRGKGAPDFSLDESLRKYYMARYRNNPIQLQKYLKMLDVEPFPHLTPLQAKTVISDFAQFNRKLYFGEWANTVPDVKWVTAKAQVLRDELTAYVEAKNLQEPQPTAVPVK